MTSSTGLSAWLRPNVRLRLSVVAVLPPFDQFVLSVLPSVTAVPSLIAVLVECALPVLWALPLARELLVLSALPHPTPPLRADPDPLVADRPCVTVGPPTQ